MTGHRKPECRGDGLSPTDPRLLTRPLEFIAADHLRERQICAMIDTIAAADVPVRSDMEAVLAFLGDEFTTHIADEREELFPLMARRCLAEDEIEDVLAQLKTDHALAEDLAPRIREVLIRCIAENRVPDEDARAALRTFSGHARHHLIVENAIVLPIARARLNDADLKSMSVAMMRRRKMDPE